MPHKVEELDAWWGSCSVRSILPGVLISLASSGLVLGAAWLFPRGSSVQLIVLGLFGLSWVGLLVSWVYRVFGINYRLTTCRLFVEMGLRYRRVQAVDLATITGVAFKTNSLEKFLGIGRVLVDVRDSAQIILRGVEGPEQVAETIRDMASRAA